MIFKGCVNPWITHTRDQFSVEPRYASLVLVGTDAIYCSLNAKNINTDGIEIIERRKRHRVGTTGRATIYLGCRSNTVHCRTTNCRSVLRIVGTSKIGIGTCHAKTCNLRHV